MNKIIAVFFSILIIISSSLLWAYSQANDIAYKIGDKLKNNICFYLPRNKPILYTSFADLDNLQQSSLLGIALGEFTASRLSQYGYQVIELKLSTKNLIIQPETGEYVLSRNIERIRKQNNCQAILVGTYSFIANKYIYISAKIVSTMDGTIISSCELRVKAGEQLKNMAEHKKRVKAAIKKNTQHTTATKLKNPYASGSNFLSLNIAAHVKIVQRRLAKKGLYTDKIDGIWGNKSQYALRTFKNILGMPNVNTWNLQTQKKLFSS